MRMDFGNSDNKKLDRALPSSPGPGRQAAAIMMLRTPGNPGAGAAVPGAGPGASGENLI